MCMGIGGYLYLEGVNVCRRVWWSGCAWGEDVYMGGVEYVFSR